MANLKNKTPGFSEPRSCSLLFKGEVVPAYLVVAPLNDEAVNNFKCLSPFAIQKGLKAILGSDPKSVTRLRSGDLLICLSSGEQSNRLMCATKLINVNIKVVPHGSLNTSKGVITCRELAGTSDNDIHEGLLEEGVVGYLPRSQQT